MPRLQRLPALALLLLVLLSPAWSGEYVTILHLNDFHGHLLPDPPDKDGHSRGGLARIATMNERVHEWNDAHGIPTMLLIAGDILQGTPLSSVYKGEPDVTCLNYMSTTQMCLGNHEFDFGPEVLFQRINQANFPLSSANVTFGGSLLPRGTALTHSLHTEKIRLIPLTTPETKVESAAANVAKFEFADPAATVRKAIAVPPLGALVVVLSHLGLPADEKLAREVPEIDVIIGGHSHDALEQPRVVGKTLICQAGSNGYYLGQLDMYVENGDVVRYRGMLRPVDERTPAWPQIAGIIDTYDQKLRKQMDQVVGHTEVALDGSRDRVRSEETNLGNAVADAAREATTADVALVNAGGIRGSLDPGPVTMGEVLTVLPFDNQLVTIELTGEQLRQVLDQNAAMTVNTDNGGFLQVSGVCFAIVDRKTRDIEVGGKPLQPDKVYKVSTVDFLSTGGNGYTGFLQGKNLTKTGIIMSKAFLDYLKAHPKLSARVECRISMEE